MKNIFQVIKYSFLCITIMLSLLLFFDYIFIKYIIFSKEYSNQNKLQQLIESENKDEIPIFGSSKARSSFIPDSISPNAFNYGMEKCNFDAVELLLNIECNKDKTTPIILEFNHRFFLHMPDHTINMGTFIPNLKYPVVRDYLEENNKITLRHDLPGFRYFGNYIYYARYYVKEKMGSKKIISRGGNFSDFVPQPKVFNNFVNARL
ncbi:MAG: hypothetical protein K8R68_00655, partial [Bacteroidales bacterium]|nr:hypothetical protein [Bacteroidales bacterium]